MTGAGEMKADLRVWCRELCANKTNGGTSSRQHEMKRTQRVTWRSWGVATRKKRWRAFERLGEWQQQIKNGTMSEWGRGQSEKGTLIQRFPEILIIPPVWIRQQWSQGNVILPRRIKAHHWQELNTLPWESRLRQISSSPYRGCPSSTSTLVLFVNIHLRLSFSFLLSANLLRCRLPLMCR